MFLFIDKTILFLCCFSLSFDKGFHIYDVINLLIALSITSLYSYFSDSKKFEKKVYLLLLLIYTVSLIFSFYLIFYLPIVIYDLILISKYYYSIILIPFSIYLLYDQPVITVGILILLIIFSISFAIKTLLIRSLSSKLKIQRDTNIEKEIFLRSKNKALVEKQDYEISLATLKERNRIAREIHDNVGHVLSRSILQLGAIIAINKSDSVTSLLQGLNDTLQSAMNSIRESVHDIHDDSIKLEYSVNELLKDYKTYSPDFYYNSSEQIPIELKYCFIGIIKEALNNISKHSNCSFFSISIKEHPGFYQLIIHDNGTNISISKKGIGLINMEERVNSLNGIFYTTMEQGFKIFTSIPKPKGR